MRPARTLLSAEEFDNYPFEEDQRYELDEGELIEMTRPAYLHNRVLMKLLLALGKYFEVNLNGGAVVGESIRPLPVYKAVSRCSGHSG